jgi:pimeloyl-ACP methyl ester carboxylesterase
MPSTPETRYAKSGDVNIAYQVVGDGPLDLVLVIGWVFGFDPGWEDRATAHFYRRLASFSRLILFDKRGTGLSDRVAPDQQPGLETRMDDVRAVLDAVGSERAALLGISEGGPMCLLFAATYPERTSALVMLGSFPRQLAAEDYPIGIDEAEFEARLERIERDWPGEYAREFLGRTAPALASDPEAVNAYTHRMAQGASPGAAAALLKMNADIDVRHVLPSVRVPTLVLQREDEYYSAAGRYMAARIPEAKLVELPGDDHLPWLGDQDTLLDEVEEFLTGAPPVHETDRVLATVLFTDIVGSTERAVELGDRRWGGVLQSYYDEVRRQLVRFRGNEVDTAGDGFFATFDGPARAVRAACAIRGAIRPLGLSIRAGLHTGECELMGEKVGGIAVHTGARVAAKAKPGEVVVSSTVKDLVAGSGIAFEERGVHELKGVPGEWRLYAVVDA